MIRRMVLVVMSLMLAVGGLACTPKLVGPTAGSGYVFSLQVAPGIIWVGQVDVGVEANFPQVAEVIVHVQDAQGRAVDGVPVTFELEPSWLPYLTLAPSQAVTQGGIARAVLSAPRTSGVVPITARVDNTIAQTRLSVQGYPGMPSRN